MIVHKRLGWVTRFIFNYQHRGCGLIWKQIPYKGWTRGVELTVWHGNFLEVADKPEKIRYISTILFDRWSETMAPQPIMTKKAKCWIKKYRNHLVEMGTISSTIKTLNIFYIHKLLCHRNFLESTIFFKCCVYKWFLKRYCNYFNSSKIPL